MADALLSPAVGGGLWLFAAGAIAACSRKVRADLDERKVPLMGVLGAFLFAAQMINFSIPGTGSSAHLGGGLLLAILLGPHAAFLTIASVLVVQALFFADGGLLALGCNIFNLGFLPAFVAYPVVYRKIAGESSNPMRLSLATLSAAIVGLQLGAFGVVLETVTSGISALPFASFVLFMLPVHLAIGLVEGVVTAAIVSFVRRSRPELLDGAPLAARPLRSLLLAFLVAALLVGGICSWFASRDPDGLEWSIAQVTGSAALPVPGEEVHARLAALQKRVALLPDYAFRKPAAAITPASAPATPSDQEGSGDSHDSRLGSSVSGIVGGTIALLVAFLAGFLLKRRGQPR